MFTKYQSNSLIFCSFPKRVISN